jgi:hypothetical protein
MGYKDKLGEGIDARGSLAFDKVHDAVESITEAMGEKVVKIDSVNEDRGIILLEVFDTGIRKIGGRSLFGAIAGAISKEPDLLAHIEVQHNDDGSSTVSVNVSEAATTSSTVLFIPAGTTVHGIVPYRDFLTHLTAELERIDPNAEITRRGKQ